MPSIEVKYDPTIVLEPIIDMMYSTTRDGVEEGDVVGSVEQTKATGIIAPLIRINDITINFSQVREFVLTSKRITPTLTMTIYDAVGLTKSLDQPNADNIVRVQIIPPFEDAYKKINLRFYITNFRTEDDLLYLTCRYNAPLLYQNRLEAFGKLSTYELVDKIAKATSLGLASNIDGIDDKRYMYCSNQSFIELLSNEITRSGTTTCIPVVWIDWFNYFNIVDIWERYKSKDKDLSVWSIPDTRIDATTGDDTKPIKVEATITNAPDAQCSQLYTETYINVNNNISNVYDGTDKIVEIYYYDEDECRSVLIQDGDVKRDTFIKTIYVGESFGSSSFQLQTICRDAVIQKINNQCIKLSLKSPCLGLVRGDKVNITWYDANDAILNAKMENDISIDTPVEDENLLNEHMTINKQITGQYLILETKLSYTGNGILSMKWNYELLLGRPADEVKTYGDDNGDKR